MIYRGQGYGDPVGTWWTTSRREAEKFAMSRGGNRTYVVVAVDLDDATDQAWLDQFHYCERAGDEGGTWYNIPIERLRERTFGVTIVSGAIHIVERPSIDLATFRAIGGGS